MIRKDSLWKGIIEDLAEEFICFFFEDHLDQIDLAKGFVFLDKELEQLSRQSDGQGRRGDKLFKAYRKGQDEDLGPTGPTEQWFLVHVEVQGYADAEFARRMFEYAYRIQDRYQRPVTALVIYTHTNRRFHFTEYRSAFMGTELSYRFRVFILMDHRPETLRQSGKLFAWVLEVARRDLELRKKDDSKLLDMKLELIRYLFQKGISKKKIRHLLDFIGAYLPFEESNFLHKFEEQLQQITKSRQPMGIREAILNDVKEQGLELGIEQGIEKKELIVVTRAWKKGMAPPDIADLADMTLERVEKIIRELEGKGTE